MKLKYIVCAAVGILLAFMYMAGYKIASGWSGEAVTYNTNIKADTVNSGGDMIIKRTTKYILETYDNDMGESSTESSSVPVQFIGYNREQLIDFIEQHREFFESGNERAVNVMLLSFSGEQIVIRRSVEYEKETETYRFLHENDAPEYYIFLRDNAVMVYKSDKTTLYMETGITADELEPAVVSELNLGVAVKNISELYRLLESYTS